ncbi:hypothetical protein [Fusobacterium sp.]|uniref:hypothetical protein n=1 Tax=Fusobacterium sp. TaxID=68766 RepID=UPI0029037646|nr:hypothetical protein [Fusobacterium sp.]MDU1910298.1 hypothetical protein [Fusobacterium sp.]
MEKEIAKVTNSIKRQEAIEKELENSQATLEHIAEQIEAGTPIPDDSKFSGYDEWQTFLEKKIKSKNSSLETIDKQKSLLAAYEFYLKNNAE